MAIDYIYILQILTLIIIATFILFSIDDLIFDFYFYINGRKKIKARLHISDLDTVSPKPIAIFIPTFNEENVIASMLVNTIISLNYPGSFYHIFVGAYQNDYKTIEAIDLILKKHSNLHLVINNKDGPTSKADNLNNLYSELLVFEQNKGLRFSVVIIHDSEDVLHPTSLKLFNFLIPKEYSAVQLPVFPLQTYPTFSSFFKYLISGTYADEFAENHFRGLVAREAAGAFVPSAGTGIAVSRQTLENLALEEENGNIFNEDNLTEDYEFGFRLELRNEKIHFFLEGVNRVVNDGSIVKEYIATREFFPNNFRQAIKQKSRWIYGITFQSTKLGKGADLDWIQRYSLIRDWKAKYANLILVPGYLLLAYIVASFFIPLPTIIERYSIAWWLSIGLTLVAIERQIMRAIALKNIYGWRSAISGCFVPPLLPIRFIVGNFINFFATIQAWRVRIFGSKEKRTKWEKTPHTYLSPEILQQYHRKLGDLMLEKDLVNQEDLSKILASYPEGKKLGEVLIDSHLTTEEELLPVLGELLKTGYIDIGETLVDPALAKFLPEELARKYNVLPILHWKEGILLASPAPLSRDAMSEIHKQTGLAPKITLAPAEHILKGITLLYSGKSEVVSKKRMGEILIDKGLIDESSFIEAFRMHKVTGKKLGQVLVDMKLVTSERLSQILLDNFEEKEVA